ncbi:T9SS type A sorting domain-containing protein [Chryseolinea soli]|uniref:T9SS C-terminal target domain-containing protein n=1 Tax=Chryseolinea soli TaxID=2321403 RepID=A0A385SRJ8_9BACT|nr:T9SS type A sorting domain-containing protein [Chryseolinea soli]AYB32595.1 T9SS C-terminal target domain-containing protein [Chryseolinea soli]
MRKSLPILVFLLFISSFVTGQSLKSIGPWDIYYAVDLVQGKNGRVFLSTSGGSYYSDNQGASWTKTKGDFNSIYYEASMTKDRDGNLFTWTFNNIYYSKDNGETWSFMIPDLTNAPKFSALGVSGDTVFIGTEKGLYYTTSLDFFSPVTEVVALQDQTITAISVTGKRVIAGTQAGGVFISEDNGKTWQDKATSFPPSKQITCLSVSGNKLFVGALFDGIYYTEDWGDHWETRNTGFSNPNIYDIFIDDNTMYVASNNKAFTSANDGNNWNQIYSEANYSTAQTIWAQGDQIILGRWHGVMKSSDGGQQWTEALTGITGAFGYTSIQASDDGSLFAFATHTGIYKKEPGSELFQAFQKTGGGYIGRGPIANNKVPMVGNYSIAYYDAITGAKGEEISLHTDSKWINFADVLVTTPQGLFLSTLQDGVYHYDGTWKDYSNNLTSTSMNDLVLVDNTLYAGNDDGLWTTDITENNWKKINIDANNPDAKFIFVQDSIFLVSTSYGFYRSGDYGKTWRSVENVSADGKIVAYKDRLYAPAISQIYVSDDRGKTWLSTTDLPFYFFTTLAIQNDVLYVGALESGILSAEINKEQEINLDMVRIPEGGSPAIHASSTSGLPITLTSSNPDVATVVDDTGEGYSLKVLKDGEITIEASQKGNLFYRPAKTQQTITVAYITASESSKTNGVTLYSNPGNGIYNLTLPDNITTENQYVTVYDAMGRPVLYRSQKIDSDRYLLDITGAPAGVYFLNVRHPKLNATLHFVKE